MLIDFLVPLLGNIKLEAEYEYMFFTEAALVWYLESL
jgi:hypothetical protein